MAVLTGIATDVRKKKKENKNHQVFGPDVDNQMTGFVILSGGCKSRSSRAFSGGDNLTDVPRLLWRFVY